jgi:hypothetical protein
MQSLYSCVHKLETETYVQYTKIKRVLRVYEQYVQLNLVLYTAISLLITISLFRRGKEFGQISQERKTGNNSRNFSSS